MHLDEVMKKKLELDIEGQVLKSQNNCAPEGPEVVVEGTIQNSVKESWAIDISWRTSSARMASLRYGQGRSRSSLCPRQGSRSGGAHAHDQ